MAIAAQGLIAAPAVAPIGQLDLYRRQAPPTATEPPAVPEKKTQPTKDRGKTKFANTPEGGTPRPGGKDRADREAQKIATGRPKPMCPADAELVEQKKAEQKKAKEEAEKAKLEAEKNKQVAQGNQEDCPEEVQDLPPDAPRK